MRALTLLLLAMPWCPVLAALAPLDDMVLSQVAGQDGISIVTAGGDWSAASFEHTQDGQTLSLRRWSRRSLPTGSNLSTTTVDSVGGELRLSARWAPAVYGFEDAVLAGSNASFGGLRLYATMTGQLRLRGGGATGGTGISLATSGLTLTDGTLYWRTNGYDLIAQGISASLAVSQASIDLTGGPNSSEVRLTLGNTLLAASIGGLRLDLARSDPTPGVLASPSAPDTRDPNSSRSMGRLDLSLTLAGTLGLSGGGASGEGLRIRPDLSAIGSLLQLQDEGVVRSALPIAALRSNSGITVDLARDAEGPHVQLAASDLNLSLTLGALTVGSSTRNRLGSLGFNLNFSDTATARNVVRLRPGGDPRAGSQGMTADLGWNLQDSAVSLTDNGNGVWFSGLRSQGTGRVQLDLTKSCTTGGITAGCFAGTQPNASLGSYDGFFDGLRIGLRDLRTSYSIDGLRVGTATAPLQGGTELLLALGVYPAFEATLNGQLTLLPGGSSGDGLRFNADLYMTNMNAALMRDENALGLWLSDARQELHVRNGTADITNDGLVLTSGEAWSALDARDLRWGDKASGRSAGRVLLRRYELGSSLTLATGGAGALCVGEGSTSQAACAAAGGRWEDRGNEGLTIRMRWLPVRDGGIETSLNGVAIDAKRNQLLMETGRTLDGQGRAIDGSGSQLVIDNFYTSDGVPGSTANTYGVQVELNVDVAPTEVRSKTAPFATTTPLGFAVNGRLQFRELAADRVQLVHPVGGAQTAISGVRMQNADLRLNLTATPIR